MSSDLVFEILSEQLPRRTQEEGREYVKNTMKTLMKSAGLKSENIITCSSPNRISLIAEKIEVAEIKIAELKKGPRIDADEKAIAGFIKRIGKKRIEDLEIRKIEGVDFYFGKEKEEMSECVDEKVRSVVQELIVRFPLHKKMKWGMGEGEWIRPVLNVLCVFAGKIVPVKVSGITANNLTYGNIRFRRESHVVSGINDYLAFLEENLVILDHEKRKRHILDSIDKFVSDSDLKYDRDDRIIDELNSMLEFPRVFIGCVDSNFFWLPKEVTYGVMTKHQKYLSLYDGEGRIVSFAAVATVVNENVIKTHEMTLRARLTDASFLIEKDKSVGLERYVEQLEKMVFKKELGNVLDKVRRITSLASYYAVWIPRAPILSVNRAAMLAKADLATLMVKEFPELQGKMGKYYAKEEGEETEVSDALEEHYLPKGQGEKVPTAPVSIAISIADKVDSLVGLMATENITGSRDPFALRRTAISLLRIIMENNINIPLDLIVAKSVSLYVTDTKKNKNLAATYAVMKDGKITGRVLDFCYERLKIILKDSNLDREVVNAVVGSCHDIVVVKRKIKVIGDYLKTEKGKLILTAYRRINNVIGKESENSFSIKRIWSKCSEKLCVESCEIDAYRKAKVSEGVLASVLKENGFNEALEVLAELSEAVITFMDGVRIHDDDSSEVRNNRVNLAIWIVDLYNMLLNFSQIPKEV